MAERAAADTVVVQSEVAVTVGMSAEARLAAEVTVVEAVVAAAEAVVRVEAATVADVMAVVLLAAGVETGTLGAAATAMAR